MTSAAPTVLAIEGDSAWIVILAVSSVTLAAVLLLRRLIKRPGGLASGLLLSLPLVLPLIAALSFDQAVLPVVAVLSPVDSSLLQRSHELLHFLLLSDQGRHVVCDLVPQRLVAHLPPRYSAIRSSRSPSLFMPRSRAASAARA